MHLSRLLRFTAAAALGLLCARALPAAAQGNGKAKATPAEREIVLKVTAKGYEPSPLKLKKGEPVHLRVTRTTDRTCATEFVLDEHKLDVPLPLDQEVSIRFTPGKAGTLKYGCGMDKMISGSFVVE